jgi:hypothetical protein
MCSERTNTEVYEFVIHANLNYHCLLFESENIRFILPFERETEELLIK